MDKLIKSQSGLSIPVFFLLLKRALQKLLHNDPLRMAGATAFFTSFALPFILIILSQLLGLVFDEEKVRSQLYQTLANVMGTNTMRQVVTILRAFRQLAYNALVTVLGTLFLLLVSTTLLMVIKSSINQLWRIRAVHGRSFWVKLKSRLQSVLIIIVTGFLFLVGILAEGLKAYLDTSVNSFSPSMAIYFTGFLNYFLSIFFVTFWFATLFRLLPDARVSWKVAFTGAFVTSILFNLGKYILRVALVNRNLNSLYGASTNIVLLLLFVFYSSLIMYFGVSFTRIWAEFIQSPITPLPHAVRYKLSAVDEASED